ncbi:MAG: acetyl-CoA carboxylase biotin carboxyl carrier protein [Rhodospirillaceae bacterium]|jgi:acetyl-CoA carboxylase biotin carboxyl carrier protein|nr:acetyl-CoA carboxylase biotin carboxyl carrier protein [Rhodospirillaceae bacterium]MBT4220523.1 acetyl-CoA carboxylase biotin carboxyl carrier protein [Rhodospirillaceae bacterium]MBT5013368.1 acetyl-CoA carboxylase biotin carboxyl carrier protein [Rhodospirillaceae bacterium]MBT6406174.1 acetyl-CoA carboxylase biotin carboxyl carrier protein [Rhodospirillaceae bacterium]MBT7354908.1 acetyl-CoA carboxylase biotin carboxyl carrier protein [Rhodospirillaceae bacterium]
MADKKPSKSKKNLIDPDMVRELAELLDETGLTEIEYGNDEWHLRVGKGATSAPATVAISAPAPAIQETLNAPAKDDGDDHANHPGVVVSPMVGTVYTSPDSDSAPFIKIGDSVSEGDTLLLIEAMKVFNPIKATKSGKVTRIFSDNATPVEFGEPLLIIE